MNTAARILLVEDERIIALEMKLFLQRLGYQVAASLATGEQALADAPAIRPDLVLMDIMLAGDLDGIETARRLRAVLPVPVVYCTAYTDPETMRRAQDTRPAGILTKPVNLDDLRRTIDQGLGRG
ncbi:MAG TPA: response regulator [Desulfovibrio sp.]|uniref:response regulator n=1 Tax=Desulfovibrio TaxID=872 RepID=UPI00041D268A|nr:MULTISPECIES: response regulator [Desulfovibrio]HMM39688.1 response regulator [Desulfovibrio sp.]